MRVLAASAGVILGWLLASCTGPAPKPCGPSTCRGCCDSNQECLAGSAVFECGTGGNACRACQANEVCRSGGCELFPDGSYDASFPGGRDASINSDAGVFDGGPEVDGGRDGGPDSGIGRPDGGPVSFMRDLAPVFSNRCVSCHPNRSTYADIRGRVTPGNPVTSLIYQKITGTQTVGNPMPPTGQLSIVDPTGTQLIELWIREGAANN